MRVVELSNHPAALLEQERELLEQQRTAAERDAERLWEAEYQRYEEEGQRVEQANADAARAYERELALHEAELKPLRDACNTFLGKYRWGTRRRRSRRLRQAEENAPRPPVPLWPPEPPAPPSDPSLLTSRTAKLLAGLEGERHVAESLSEAFDDEWTLLRGYRNRHGEIDQLLLGPVGLVAIEVKHRNATVQVNGDQWWFQKFDRYGNLVEQGLMSDGAGRSPSQQLTEPAWELQKFLARRGQPIQIDRVVMLSHPGAGIGHCENLTVAIVCDVAELTDTVRSWDARLEPEQAAKIAQLIAKHHELHEKRSRDRSSSPS